MYTNETAEKRLKELLLLKGTTMAEVAEKLKMSQQKIITGVVEKGHGVAGAMVKLFNDRMVHGYLHNPKNFGIRNGEIVLLVEERP